MDFSVLSLIGQSAATKFWGQRFDLKEYGEGRGANQEARGLGKVSSASA